LKQIKGVMKNKSQIKGLKWNWSKRRRFGVECSSSSLERLLEWPSFQGILCFIAPLNWTKLTPKWSPNILLHLIMFSFGRLTPQRWWHHPKMANPTSHFPAKNLTAHDGYFEPTARILLGRTKGQDLAPVETKHPLPTPINRWGFHILKEEK